ncbi:hypothetical protein NEF87_000422 [Candidatus Lokiarchaeum ossiferum]|uniref:DUF4064 domain-containing protein n=1 Tax=Candidatus Lokiarchaeum ossiferum TaxID=2951803 RepID=A0ABY6HP14_9ARCH|nr:hypothetical protein NEF87_000422 [Candidatus Lokiarchaeum sp. B-35]
MAQIDFQQIITDLGGIGMVLIMLLIVVVVMTLALKIGINAVKGEQTGLGEVFITGILMITLFILITFATGFFQPSLSFLGSIISLIIGLFILKSRHNTTFLGAFGALIIFIVVLAIISFLFSYFISGALLTFWNIFYPGP